jgi:hypothetical protein
VSYSLCVILGVRKRVDYRTWPGMRTLAFRVQGLIGTDDTRADCALGSRPISSSSGFTWKPTDESGTAEHRSRLGLDGGLLGGICRGLAQQTKPCRSGRGQLNASTFPSNPISGDSTTNHDEGMAAFSSRCRMADGGPGLLRLSVFQPCSAQPPRIGIGLGKLRDVERLDGDLGELVEIARTNDVAIRND